MDAETGVAGFKTIDDVKDVAREMVEFANDACCGHLFEVACCDQSNLFREGSSRGAIFTDTVPHRLALRINPDLKNEPTFETLSKLIPAEIQERLLEIIVDYRESYLTLGMILGAREADPTGKSCERVANGWVKAILARPRYCELEPRKKRGGVK